MEVSISVSPLEGSAVVGMKRPFGVTGHSLDVVCVAASKRPVLCVVVVAETVAVDRTGDDTVEAVVIKRKCEGVALDRVGVGRRPWRLDLNSYRPVPL